MLRYTKVLFVTIISILVTSNAFSLDITVPVKIFEPLSKFVSTSIPGSSNIIIDQKKLEKYENTPIHVILDLDFVPFDSDDALNVVLVGLKRADEDNYFSSLGVFEFNQTNGSKGNPKAIEVFVDEDLVTDGQRRNHGSTWDLKRFDNKRPKRECNQDRHDDRLN